jgi:hypothetical protein
MVDKEKELLKSTLREILRLKQKAASSSTAVSFDDIFDNTNDAKMLKHILQRAAALI